MSSLESRCLPGSSPGAWPQPPAGLLSPGGGALLDFAGVGGIWLKGMKGIL